MNPKQEPLKEQSYIGKSVTVYNKHLFAVPVRGIIVGVSDFDDAFQIRFNENNPGGRNVTTHNGEFFFRQECGIEKDKVENLLMKENKMKEPKFKVGDWVSIVFNPMSKSEEFPVAHILESQTQLCEAGIEQITYVVRIWTGNLFALSSGRLCEIELGEVIAKPDVV